MFDNARQYWIFLCFYLLVGIPIVSFFLRDLFFVYSWSSIQAGFWTAVFCVLFLCLILVRWYRAFRWGVFTGAALLCFVLGFRLFNAGTNYLLKTENEITLMGIALALVAFVGSVGLLKHANRQAFLAVALVVLTTIVASVWHVQIYIDLTARS